MAAKEQASDRLFDLSVELGRASDGIIALSLFLDDGAKAAISHPTTEVMRDAFTSIADHVIRISQELEGMGESLGKG